jgi:hypothetical protein
MMAVDQSNESNLQWFNFAIALGLTRSCLL